MKIFVVTDGEYSDYRINGVFSTREKAEYGKEFYNADNDIEEIELDSLPETPNGCLKYCVNMDKEGNNTVERENSSGPIYREWVPYGNDKDVCFEVFAEDEKHAIKIANEKRIGLINSDQWTTSHNEWLNKYHNK